MRWDWLLPLFLLVVWSLWAAVMVVDRAAQDAGRGIPEGQRGGVSVTPIIPIVPMVFWGIAWLIDRAVSPWGTWLVAVAHGVFAVCLAVSLVRDWRRLRLLDEVDGRDRS